MKKSIYFLVLIFFSVSLFSKEKFTERPISLEDKIFTILEKEHKEFFQLLESQEDEFTKLFFTDFHFLKSNQTRDFFRLIHLPNNTNRIMNISYMEYSNINGVSTGVSYELQSNGKDIVLTKGTLKDGKLLKATYRYDPKGKSLEVNESQNNKILQKNLYPLEV
ncbi:MAG: hypothetical protein H7A24_05395 [Leptospiraceae bacterium]|nr:hypothetical protein [Leptospiraceae bacterium]MCP5511292.1 hypothetical protein [Leptospiraceae bacterium]